MEKGRKRQKERKRAWMHEVQREENSMRERVGRVYMLVVICMKGMYVYNVYVVGM